MYFSCTRRLCSEGLQQVESTCTSWLHHTFRGLLQIAFELTQTFVTSPSILRTRSIGRPSPAAASHAPHLWGFALRMLARCSNAYFQQTCSDVGSHALRTYHRCIGTVLAARVPGCHEVPAPHPHPVHPGIVHRTLPAGQRCFFHPRNSRKPLVMSALCVLKTVRKNLTFAP